MAAAYTEHRDFLRARLVRLGVPYADADDALQTVFAKAIAAQAEGRYQERGTGRAWLAMIARNVAYDDLDRRIREFAAFDRLVEPPDVPEPVSGIDRLEAAAAFRERLTRSGLTGAQARALAVFYLLDLDEQHGAALLGESKGAFRSSRYRAIEQLRRTAPAHAGVRR